MEEFHSILDRCKSHFCQLFNLHDVKDVKQTAIHIAEPEGPEPSVFEVEMAIETLERYKSHGTDKQNWVKEKVEQNILRYIHLWIVSWIWKNA